MFELFTDRARRVIVCGVAARHARIGTKHLLLGLVEEGEGTAAQVLDDLALGLPNVRLKVISILDGPSAT